VRAELEGNRLQDDKGGEKATVSLGQAGQLAMDDGALEEVRLLALLGAECAKDNEGRVGDQRGELDAIREIGQREQEDDAGKHDDDERQEQEWAIKGCRFVIASWIGRQHIPEEPITWGRRALCPVVRFSDRCC
jgi:hypothetical protein